MAERIFLRFDNNINGENRSASPLNPCPPFWVSPSLRLVAPQNPRPNDGPIDETTARAGAAQDIEVTVNATTAVSDVDVQVWVANPTLGFGPVSGIASAGGSSGLTGFIASIPAGSTGTARMRWVADANDVNINQGHVCLAANCFIDGVEGARLGLNDSVNACGNAHHAIRNIAVRAVSNLVAEEEFAFFAANPELEEELEFELEIQQLERRALTELERSQLLTGPFVRLDEETFGGEREQRVQGEVLADEPERPGNGDDRPGRRRGLVLKRSRKRIPVRLSRRKLRELDLASPGGSGRKVRLRLQGGQREKVAMRVRFDPEDEAGDLHLFHIVQRGRDGTVVGGLQVMTLLEP